MVERARKVSGAAGLSPEQTPLSCHPANLLDRIWSGLGVSAEKPGWAFVPKSHAGHLYGRPDTYEKRGFPLTFVKEKPLGVEHSRIELLTF